MCRNQLGRRNITNEQKTALIAEAYKAQKMSRGNNADRGPDGKYLMNRSGSSGGERTSRIIAKEFGVGQGTVQRAVEFANGLDAAEKVLPGIKDAVLSGEIKATKKVIAGIRSLPEEKQKAPQRPLQRFRGRGGVLTLRRSQSRQRGRRRGIARIRWAGG